MPTRILSVDDSRTIRLIVARALRPYDCQLFEAGNGEEGLALATREHPQIIILDITMPVMDGVTMLGRLRENPELKDVPVVMLTAESGPANMAYVNGLGVSSYLVKPFTETQLIEAVAKVVPLPRKTTS